MLQKYITNHAANVMSFFKMNFFLAALKPDLRGVVAQKDQKDMMNKKMYKKPLLLNRKPRRPRNLLPSEVNCKEQSNHDGLEDTDVAAFGQSLAAQGGVKPKNTGNAFQYCSNRNFKG
jgi:hypothetical protein